MLVEPCLVDLKDGRVVLWQRDHALLSGLPPVLHRVVYKSGRVDDGGAVNSEVLDA